jgi:thiol-disulfide isomerase/thioredoxin
LERRDLLRGKVVLVDFWTYTCINWLRTLAYVRAWAEKYKERGLVVVGVHTPEFPFERDIDNVRRAATDMNVWYAIALDSDYEASRAGSLLRLLSCLRDHLPATVRH